MKIKFSGGATAHNAKTNEVVTDSDTLRQLAGWSSQDEALYLYLDSSLGDIGIIGGIISLDFLEHDGLMLHIEYWSPRELSESELKALADDTLGQLSDGVGENGFEIPLTDSSMVVLPGNEILSCLQYEDGRAIPDPSIIAKSARDGDWEALVNAISLGSEIESTLQGYTGLQLAILYGKAREAMFLIEHGADPNRISPHGDETPLQLCALSNSLNDDESAMISRSLLEHGADRFRRSETGNDASEFAKLRNKVQMLQVLAESASQ